MINSQFPPNRSAREDNAKDLILVPVGVKTVQVRATVHADNLFRYNLKTRFFPHLTNDSIGRFFTRLHRTARQAPLIIIRSPLEQYLTLIVTDKRCYSR